MDKITTFILVAFVGVSTFLFVKEVMFDIVGWIWIPFVVALASMFTVFGLIKSLVRSLIGK